MVESFFPPQNFKFFQKRWTAKRNGNSDGEAFVKVENRFFNNKTANKAKNSLRCRTKDAILHGIPNDMALNKKRKLVRSSTTKA